MSEIELKEWLWNKLNSCYEFKLDKYPDNVFMFYDINFIRKNKFKILQGNEIVYPTTYSGECLFQLDYHLGIMYCDYNNIWSVLKTNTNYDYYDIRDMVIKWINEYINNKYDNDKIYDLLKGYNYTRGWGVAFATEFKTN